MLGQQCLPLAPSPRGATVGVVPSVPLTPQAVRCLPRRPSCYSPGAKPRERRPLLPSGSAPVLRGECPLVLVVAYDSGFVISDTDKDGAQLASLGCELGGG